MNTYIILEEESLTPLALYEGLTPNLTNQVTSNPVIHARFIASDPFNCWVHQVDGEWIAEDYPVVEE